MKIDWRDHFFSVHTFPLCFSLSSLFSLALGLVLIFAPHASKTLLCAVIGAGVTAYGFMSLLPFLLDRKSSFHAPALPVGVCALAFGIFSLLRPAFLLNVLFIVLGLIAALASIGGVRRSLRLHTFGDVRWTIPLLLSLGTFVLALTFVFFPGFYGNTLMRIIGFVLCLQASVDLLTLKRLSHYNS